MIIDMTKTDVRTLLALIDEEKERVEDDCTYRSDEDCETKQCYLKELSELRGKLEAGLIK